jgi:tetratricopeptide (TPR) repeat protein
MKSAAIFAALVAASPAFAEERSVTFETEVEVKHDQSAAELCALGATEQDDLQAALKYCDAAVAAEPRAGENYYYRGFVKFYLDDFKGAEADFTSAIDSGSKYVAKSYHQRGVCKEKQGRLRDASTDFRKAHEIDPDYGPSKRKFEEYWWAYQ